MARLNADVLDDLRKRLLHGLVDENISFAKWLRRRADLPGVGGPGVHSDAEEGGLTMGVKIRERTQGVWWL